jgi:hypothetical protein
LAYLQGLRSEWRIRLISHSRYWYMRTSGDFDHTPTVHEQLTNRTHRSYFIALTRYKTLCGVAYSNLASSKIWTSAVGWFFCHACLWCLGPCDAREASVRRFSKAAASLAEGCIINLPQMKEGQNSCAVPFTMYRLCRDPIVEFEPSLMRQVRISREAASLLPPDHHPSCMQVSRSSLHQGFKGASSQHFPHSYHWPTLISA